jgi:flagellar motility protein MotE (MotC chaperone)
VMGVYCGVCATRLSDATENYGGFAVGPSFANGWDRHEHDGRATVAIAATCESCSRALQEAVAVAASKIAAKHAPGVKRLADAVAAERAREDQRRADRADFEEAWKKERARLEEERKRQTDEEGPSR